MASGTVSPEVERVLSSPLDARVLRILQRPGAHLKRGDPVVELDISESVLALEKVVKDLKIKENQQAQSRLTLEKSLRRSRRPDRGEGARAAVGAVAARERPAAVQGRAALARGAAAIRAGGEAGADRARRSCASERQNAERADRRAARRALARARLARQGSGAGAPPARPLDDEVGSRRRADVGAAAGRRARAPRRRHRAHRRPHVVPRRRARSRTSTPAGCAPACRRSSGSTTSDLARHGHRSASRRSRTACIRFTVALAEPSHAGAAPEPARRRARHHRPQAARAARQARAVRRQRRAPGVRRPRRPRGPRPDRARRLAASTTWKWCRASSEGDEVIISDMQRLRASERSDASSSQATDTTRTVRHDSTAADREGVPHRSHRDGRARRREPRRRRRGVHLGHGTVGLRQEHAAQPDRAARRADEGHGRRSTGRRSPRYRDRALAAIRNKEIGFVFQTFHLVSDLSVLDNVQIPLLYRRMSNGERRKLARPRSTASASRRASITSRRSSRAASSSASPSPARSSAGRASCSPTSRPATSTRRWATRSWRSSRTLNHERQDDDRDGDARSAEGGSDRAHRAAVRRPAGELTWRRAHRIQWRRHAESLPRSRREGHRSHGEAFSAEGGHPRARRKASSTISWRSTRRRW